jgi:hypothetical protein
LGDATNVNILKVEWPSGIVQTLTNVPAKQILTVREHQSAGTAAPTTTVAEARPLLISRSCHIGLAVT